MRVPSIKYISVWNGVECPVLDEYYSTRDKCWYVFLVYEMQVHMVRKGELMVPTRMVKIGERIYA